jgi:hypothetical protein
MCVPPFRAHAQLKPGATLPLTNQVGPTVTPVTSVTAACSHELIIVYRGRLLASGIRTWRITTNLTMIFASLSQIANWLKRQWVMEVPEELAFCEFECRRTECQMFCCQRRLGNLSGELTPAAVGVRVR